MNRRWQALSFLVPRKLAAAAGKEMVRLGSSGVQEDHPPGFTPRYRQPWDKGPAPPRPKNVLLRGWFSERPSEQDLQLLREVALSELSWEEQQEQDWEEEWKKHFDTLVISERLTITPPWKPVEGAVVIEPGNAFGTGDHPTTRACLEGIDAWAGPGRLLDVGCGSGILALAAARLGMTAVGVDIDPDAVASARAAALQNGLEVEFSTTSVENLQGTYEIVVANLYAEVLAALAPHLLRLSGRGTERPGTLIFAGILADRAHLVRAAYFSAGPPQEKVEGDWVSLVYPP